MRSEKGFVKIVLILSVTTKLLFLPDYVAQIQG